MNPPFIPISPTSSPPSSQGLPAYAELFCMSNFSFLQGALREEGLIARAAELDYAALAITDECSLPGWCARLRPLKRRAAVGALQSLPPEEPGTTSGRS